MIAGCRPISQLSPILVADDDPRARRLFVRELRSAGYPVSEARSGQEAITHLHQTPFRLLVLDLDMPGSDRFGVPKTLRANFLHLQVLVVSGVLHGEHLKAAEFVGARLALDNATAPQRLVETARKLLGDHQAPGAAPGSASTSGAVASMRREGSPNLTPSNDSLSVVVVDDHPVVRDGLCAMISAEPDIHVAAEVGTGNDALNVIPKLRPAVVVMDLLLPDIGGSEVIRRLSAQFSDTGFIVLTTVAGDEEIYRALEAGARGYLFKDMARKELIHAIRTVAKGQRYIPAQVGSRIAENLPRPGLTAREIDVLQFVAGGMRNKEIAYQLGVSEATINAHVKHILEKLNASDRTHAVTTALKRGIIRL